MDRKEFLKTSFLGTAALAVAPLGIVGCNTASKKDESEIKLSFQEWTAPGETLEQRFDFMESLGIVGIEPGGKGLKARVPELKSALSGRSIKISAICAGFDGFILSEEPASRDIFDKTMREIISAAGELDSTGVIMVPAFNWQKPCMPHNQQARDYLCEELRKLGDYALECGTTIILEPLNRAEAFYLRQVADAAAIARDSQSKGVKAMGDFWHMKEETSDFGALHSAGKDYLQHVHIASRGRRLMPGEDGAKDNYIDGFRALKQMGYDKYISFECGTQGDKAITAKAAVELIRKQWKEA